MYRGGTKGVTDELERTQRRDTGEELGEGGAYTGEVDFEERPPVYMYRTGMRRKPNKINLTRRNSCMKPQTTYI
jgi:hypothetical protein